MTERVRERGENRERGKQKIRELGRKKERDN